MLNFRLFPNSYLVLILTRVHILDIKFMPLTQKMLLGFSNSNNNQYKCILQLQQITCPSVRMLLLRIRSNISFMTSQIKYI